MRKRIINPISDDSLAVDHDWLALEQLAQVEISSEDSAHPIESALLPGAGSGWRAAAPGEQTIRLLFDEPLRLKRINLVFGEDQHERTQEFTLRWSSDGGKSYREIVRQQFNFSPPETNREVEDYRVEHDGVTALELRIIPDLSGRAAFASLAQLRLA
jgi:hypothetical protein